MIDVKSKDGSKSDSRKEGIVGAPRPATGLYSLDPALALHRAEGVEVMVANPRAMADFAKALSQRSKTDDLDAEVMLEYARQIPFVAWQPPITDSSCAPLMRRITALKLASQ
jgi:transposase